LSIEVHSLNVACRERMLLANISFSLQPGSVTAIVGPNGAGKSTLLSCLAGLRSPNSGRVLLNGSPIESIAPPARARSLALLPQGAEIHWNLHVRPMVELGRLPWRGSLASDVEDARIVETAMHRVDIMHLAKREAFSLSGGERGRTLMARSLAVGADWLLADEPLAGLDPLHQLTALAALRAEAGKGAGIVLVIHDLSLASRFADQILVLHDGCLVAHGPPQAVLTSRLLEEVYQVSAHIDELPGGGLIIEPLLPKEAA
jgi:iron complex transport system ATP-binding protein